MSDSEKLCVVMKREVVKNSAKETGKLTNDETLKPYRRSIDKFCKWAEEMGICRVHHIAQNGYSPVTLVQKYADHLMTLDLKPTSIHTYLAPVCKGLGISMAQISKPSRLSKDIVKIQNSARTKLAQGS